MSTLLLVLGAGAVLLLAYHTYGRWLARRVFELGAGVAAEATPAHRLADGCDYVPTRRSVVFGHHFTSIAATGPIVGPAIAVIWGWLPALLWVIGGSVLIGAVHDLGSLAVSLRSDGRTVGEVAGRVLNRRVRLVFLAVLALALTIVLAIFGLVIAAVFRACPSSILPVLLQVPIAAVIGVALHRRGAALLPWSLAAFAVMVGLVVFGDAGWLGVVNAWLASWPTIVWVAVLLGYCYVASVLPVWVLLQPRDYINALLLVACPCALILCGPTAIVAALSSAARLGVYVKSVADLEVVRRVTAFVFDKTGTLTTGRLTVSRMKPVEGVDPAELLRVAAAAEANSRHPVAQAVTAIARKANIEPPVTTDASEVAGRGVQATLDGDVIRVGRPSWLESCGVDPAELAAVDQADAEGLSLLFVARGQRVLGWIGLADTLREDASAAIDDLAAEGVKQRVMITGDRRSPAARVASQLKLTGFTAEALPGDKLALVNELKANGHTVAVIGDGVNDGPALAAGHVSLAMGAAGSDVAIDAASIALMNNQLDRLPFLVQLSRRTITVIRQNLAFTLAYILVMLLLLGLGYLTPLWAAIGHGVSSIAVVFNSARLVRQGEHLQQVESRRESAHEPAEAEPARVAPRLEAVPA